VISLVPCFSTALAAGDLSSQSPSSTSLFDEATFQSIQHEKIGCGRVYHHKDFLTENEVCLLLDEIESLKDSFRKSGLSNTAQENQGFGLRDRSLCAVPWWPGVLQGQSLPHMIGKKINQVRLELAERLNRPTMLDAGLAHECYYSVSYAGSTLKRHMDERHEELKGPKGWLLPSRRSLSWLIYMSDDNWSLDGNGGALRTFPQVALTSSVLAQHQGNLQIGWLQDPLEPVYLDCWYRPAATDEPRNILYTIDENGNEIVLTNQFSSSVAHGRSLSEFLQHARLSLFLNEELATRFTLLENRELWDKDGTPEGSEIVDVVPLRRSLVVFDSVLLPHQVEMITKGNRIALAGWFHEATQAIPEMM
jgi:2OG-Fe(II) oxygenase superfamily